MNEHFTGAPSLEQERKERVERIDKALQEVARTRDLMIANIQTLDLNIPHDDVRDDQATYSYHVIRNAWMADVDGLDLLEKALHELRVDASMAN